MATLGIISDETILGGINFMKQHLLSVLESHHILKIPAEVGMVFDPQFHEAIEVIPSENIEGETKTVIAEISFDGFTLHDRVIRPTRVKLTKQAN